MKGEGFPIVCLHNAGADSTIWQYQIEYFQSNYQTIVLDLPGYGASNRPMLPYTLEFYTEILDEFLNTLQITQCYLLGNCIGASIALNYSKQNPSRIKAMALSNICGGIQMMQLLSPMLFINKKILPMPVYSFFFRFNRFRWIRKKVIKRLFGLQIKQPLFDYLVELQNHQLHNQSRKCMLQGLDSFDTFSIDYQYKATQLPPVILFWGQHNQVFSSEWASTLKPRIDFKVTYIVENAGHLLMYEAPQFYNLKVKQFFEANEQD